MYIIAGVKTHETKAVNATVTGENYSTALSITDTSS
jgi:hypothetical protein